MTSVSLSARIESAQVGNTIPSIGVLLGSRDVGIVDAYNTPASDLTLIQPSPTYASHYPSPKSSVQANDISHVLYDMGSTSPILTLTVLEILHSKGKFSSWDTPLSQYLPGLLSSFYENVTMNNMLSHRACFNDDTLSNMVLNERQKYKVKNMQGHCYWPGPEASCRRGENVRIGAEGLGATVLNATTAHERFVRWHVYPAKEDSIVHVDDMIVDDGTGMTCLTKIVLCIQNVATTVFGWAAPIDNCVVGESPSTYSDKILLTVLQYLADAVSASAGYSLVSDSPVSHEYHVEVWVQVVRELIFRTLSMDSANSFIIQQENGKWITTLTNAHKFARWFSYGLNGEHDPNTFGEQILPLPVHHGIAAGVVAPELTLDKNASANLRKEQFQSILSKLKTMQTCDINNPDKWCFTTPCDATFMKFDASGKIILGSGVPYGISTSRDICTNKEDRTMWREYTNFLEIDLWMDRRYFETKRWAKKTSIPSPSISSPSISSPSPSPSPSPSMNSFPNNNNNKDIIEGEGGTTLSFLSPSSSFKSVDNTFETPTQESGIGVIVLLLLLVTIVCMCIVWVTGKYRSSTCSTSIYEKKRKYAHFENRGKDRYHDEEEEGKNSQQEAVEVGGKEEDLHVVEIQVEPVNIEMGSGTRSGRKKRLKKKKKEGKRDRRNNF